MVLPKQSYSFSSYGEPLSSSQYDQNSISNAGDGIRRVTIRQLLDASPTQDSTLRFKINGIGIKKVMIVVNVYFDNPTHAGRSYGFDDGSGRINGYSRDVGTGIVIESFGFARVFGELDQYNGLKSFKVFNIQPICDPHEVYFHILHSIVDTLTYERGPPPLKPDYSIDGGQLDSINSALQQISVSDHRKNSSNSMSISSAYPPQASCSISPTTNLVSIESDCPRPDLSRLDRDVLLCISDPSLCGEHGVHIEDIVPFIRSRHQSVTSEKLFDSMEFLLEQRYICTTIDDSHYQLVLE